MATIRPLQRSDFQDLRNFTDLEIGQGYYSLEDIMTIYNQSQKDGVMCTLLLLDEDKLIVGARISYPPGQWRSGKGKGLNPDKWPYKLNETAYFQSLFLSERFRGQGWGGRLSLIALDLLKQTGAKGVVCHSWKESPNNSSTRYLQKLGFLVVDEYLRYWQDVSYNCTRCKAPPCQCTAQEMYLDLMRGI